MKNIIILFSLFVVFSSANAQKKQNVYFFKNNGKEVDTKDSADYARIIQEPDSGETNYILKEFYSNGNRKTAGKVSAFEPRLRYEGVIMRFDKAGKRKEITTFEKGVPLGMSYHYFSNGNLEKQIEYLPNQPSLPMSMPGVNLADVPFNVNSKLIYLADSVGKVYIEEGKGHFIDTIKTPTGERVEEGDYMDGVKHGLWKGNESTGLSFIETYNNGKLVSGESTKEGVKYAYTNKETFPEFKSGMSKFYQYLGNSIRYPSDAARNGIEGTVILEYTVERDGSLSEITVKQSVYPSIDDEAKRVVKLSPKWIPATLRGVPVRVKYTVPIKFTMPR